MPGEARVHEVGDAVGEHAGLARAGAGEDEQRALAVRHGGALLVVETLEQALRSGRLSPALTSPRGYGRRPAGTLPAMRLTEEVRRTAQEIAAERPVGHASTSRRSAPSSAPLRPELDPSAHYLEGSEDDVATFLVCLDTINFGSGWWPTIRKRPGMSGYFTMATGLAERFRAARRLERRRAARRCAPRRSPTSSGQARDHELMALYAQALRELGRWLGGRADARGGRARRTGRPSASRRTSPTGMAMFDDRGFYKRAQIVAVRPRARRRRALPRPRPPHDLRRQPRPARPALRRRARLRPAPGRSTSTPSARCGWARRSARSAPCAVHACELIAARLGVSAHTLDHWLWQRGQAPEYKARPRHRCRTVFY